MFDIDHILIHILGYPLSYVECIGAIFGVICVWLAAKSNIWTWATGLVNIVCLAIIFYQVHLYADMFLQVYFFVMSVYGWVRWYRIGGDHSASFVRTLSSKQRLWYALLILGLTYTLGLCVARLHLWFPSLFTHPASFAFVDTFIAICSIVATFWMARRILENWVLWVVVDVLCVVVYLQKNIRFIALEYLILLGFASYGLYFWWKLWKKSPTRSTP